MSLYSNWNKIDNQYVKWGIAILVIAVFAAIIWQVVKYFKNQKRKQYFSSDYNNLINSGQKPSYPDTSYIQMADKIYEAGCPYGAITGCLGTDEQAIYDVFNQMNNELDVLLLVRAFGSRTPRGTVAADAVDLGGFLSTELSGDNISQINSTLASKDIKYRF